MEVHQRLKKIAAIYVILLSNVRFCVMLLDCPNLQDIWQMYFTASSLKDSFQSVDN